MLTAVERAKQVSMSELNAIIGVSQCEPQLLQEKPLHTYFWDRADGSEINLISNTRMFPIYFIKMYAVN